MTNETTTAEESNSKKQIMKLPYAGEKGCSIIKSLKKYLKKTLPTNIEADIFYTDYLFIPKFQHRLKNSMI